MQTGISRPAAQIALYAEVMVSADLPGELKDRVYTPGETTGACAKTREQP